MNDLEIVMKIKERINKAKTESAVLESKIEELKYKLLELSGTDNIEKAKEELSELKAVVEENRHKIEIKVKTLQNECF